MTANNMCSQDGQENKQGVLGLRTLDNGTASEGGAHETGRRRARRRKSGSIVRIEGAGVNIGNARIVEPADNQVDNSVIVAMSVSVGEM